MLWWPWHTIIIYNIYKYISGITPLYDAASNGHLEVVQLLLEKGAIPSLKTDFGETPLQVLQKWRTGTILTKDEETLYNNICNKINNFIEKSNPSELVFNRSKSKTPVKAIQNNSPPSTSKMTRIKELYSPAFKRRNIIDDDSDEEINISQNVRNQTAFPSDSNSSDEEDSKESSSKTSGVKEYRNAISALRNRNVDLPDIDDKKIKTKPALLNPDEVDDDWLDDDIGIMNRTKKRKLSDPLTTVVAKKTSMDSLKESIDNLNKISPLTDNNTHSKKKSRINDIIDHTENSSDSEQFQINENVCPMKTDESMRNIAREFNDSKSKDTRDNMRRRWKRQSTLLRAGFQRKKSECDQSSNSGSDTEVRTKSFKKRVSNGSFSRHSSNENFNYSNSNDGFSIMQNINPNIVQPLNVIQPINIVQSKNGRAMQTQILPPAAVKVKIEDKVLLISLKLDMINKLTISWLVEEVKSRYYK